MATVDANSSVTCQLPVSGIAITEAERVGGIELQWGNGTNTFVIETSSMEQYSECYSQYVHTVMFQVWVVCNGMSFSITLNFQNCVMSCCNGMSLFGLQYIHKTYFHFLIHFQLLVDMLPPPTVVLYNCGDLSGNDCSGCLGLSADYSCGYCQPNCILNSLTCGSSVIQAPSFQQCGAINVTEVSEFMLFILSTTYVCI